MPDDITHESASPDKIAVVLLGMHRSGSSALSRALTSLGFDQPDDAVHGRTERTDDPGEPQAIVQLNSRILKELGVSWDDPRLLTVRSLPLRDGSAAAQLVVRDTYIADALRALATSFAGRSRIVLKECRVSLFTELWHAALKQAGYAPKYLLCFRDPVEVAQSIRAHANLFAPRVHQLWLRYNLAVLAPESRSRLAGVVGYDELLAEDGAGLDRVIATLDLNGAVTEPMREAGRRALDTAARHFTVPVESTLGGAMLATATKTMYATLRNWNSDDPAGRRDRLAEATAAFDEFSLLAGSVVALSPPRVVTPPPRPMPTPPVRVAPRALLLHYHLFKNAGTSLDAILAKSFGARWMTQEFANARREDQQSALVALLAERPDLIAVSSHTLLLPLPGIDGVQVLPALFLRHPIDRLRSAYDFEHTQGADTTGSRLARETDFAGYIRHRLDSVGDTFCRNFQTHRLAMGRPDPNLTEIDRALAMLDLLPFVGLVEAFDASIARLQDLARPSLPDFRGFAIHRNATARDSTLEQRLQATEAQLGAELYQILLDANRGDMALYNTVRLRYRGE